MNRMRHGTTHETRAGREEAGSEWRRRLMRMNKTIPILRAVDGSLEP